MNTRALLLVPALVLAWPLLAGAAQTKQAPLDPQLPYQAEKNNPVTYEVDFAVAVTAPAHTRVLRVWLPLPQSDAAQEVEERELTAFPSDVKPRIAMEPVFGNKFAYFEFDHPEGAQLIRHKFKVKVWELHWEMDPAKVVSVKKWPKTFAPYLRTDQSVVVNDRLRRLVQKIVPQRRGEAADLARVLFWVEKNITYDHSAASLRASSEHALKGRRGHCSDYHGLCAAFGRSLGYPTRVTYGINSFPKNSPSHCKLEVYLPPYGWVSFDVSETQNLMRKIKKDPKLGDKEQKQLLRAANRRLLRGFRDNTWYLQTRGTDYDLAPPAARRVPVVRTIYAEADGVPLPDPDPADPKKHEFAWMTIHKFVADKTVPYPFKDWQSLRSSK
jgi:transglutaminase-like putative cysteine protease